MFLIILFTFFLSTSLFSDDIYVASDFWMPMNGEPGSDEEGYVVEIMRYIYENNGHSINYNIVPWARAINAAKTGSVDVIIGAFPEEVPGFYLPEEPAGVLQLHFWKRADDSWTFNGEESLYDRRIGVIAEYSYWPWLMELKAEKPELFQEVYVQVGLQALINLLLRDRIDIIPASAPIMIHMLQEQNLLSTIRSGGVDSIGDPRYFYIAFSPVNEKSEDYAEMFSEGIRLMRENGKLQEILDKYNLDDF